MTATLRARVLRIFGNALLPLCAAGLALGLAFAWAGRDDLATIAWAVPSGIVGVRLAWSILRDLMAGEAGVDVIAVLAIGGALAMEEFVAAAIITLMLATGETLERYAAGRAHRELTALLSRAPRDVHRYEDGELITRPIDAVIVGDRLLVMPGEIVPVDGLALTGEARPVTRVEGDQVNSGTLNAGGPSTSGRSPQPRSRRMPGSSGWSGRRRARRRPSCGSRTGTRSSSSRSRSPWRASPG